jgi:hypothetical protein
MKLPFMKFFPRDWMGDEALRLCSLPARGLWIDLLCLMHSSPRRGYLQTANGLPLPLEQIARMTGCSTDEVTRLLQELKDSGTCDCTEHGMIFSRRIVREESKRAKCSDAGKKGGGNPYALKDLTFKGEPKGEVKGGDKGEGKGHFDPQRLRCSEKELIPPNPPKTGGEEEKKTRRKSEKPRARNATFDALAEVTGIDVSIRSAARTVATKAAELAAAEPPYPPAMIREFGVRFHEFCSWARKDGREKPTPGEVVKHIHNLRAAMQNAEPIDPREKLRKTLMTDVNLGNLLPADAEKMFGGPLL